MVRLTAEDIKILLDWGYSDDDLEQIEEAMQPSKTKYDLDGKRITRDEAIALLGQKQYLSGIARSAFHYTASRLLDDGRSVGFDSYRMFI